MPAAKSKAEAATEEVAAEPAVKTVEWRDQQFELPAAMSFGAGRMIARIQTSSADPELLFAFIDKLVGTEAATTISDDLDPLPIEEGIEQLGKFLERILEQYGTSSEN